MWQQRSKEAGGLGMGHVRHVGNACVHKKSQNKSVKLTIEFLSAAAHRRANKAGEATKR